jgi:glycosyltransferase involved in cell wall biosynthesis
MTKLSICIPNFNRIFFLDNCLNSIKKSSENSSLKFEVCISDNNSIDKVEEVISKYKKFYNIKFSKNSRNLGLGVNILKSVSLASGEYVWIIGNDDLLLENTLFKLNELFELHKDVDFFYINSFHMDSTLLHKYKFPFDTNNIKKLNLKKFSKSRTSKKLNFFELINTSLSFDFLLGMFLCIFKKKNWDQNLFIIDEKKISDLNVYSTFDNT